MSLGAEQLLHALSHSVKQPASIISGRWLHSGIADGQIGASGKSLFSGAAIGDVIRDKWPAIRHEVVRRYSPVQHIPLLGLLVYFLP